jgi:hypothetical protein
MARAATAGGDGGSNLTRYCIQHASSSNSPGLAAVARTGIFATGFDARRPRALLPRAVLGVSVCHGWGKRGVSRPPLGGSPTARSRLAEGQGADWSGFVSQGRRFGLAIALSGSFSSIGKEGLKR